MAVPASQANGLQLKIAQRAQSDMSQILEWTQHQHGTQAAIRYLELMKLALNDILIKPNRLGVHAQPSLPRISLYHLRHSTKRLPKEQHVKQPKHILVFRVSSKRLHVVRLLHESMDVDMQLSTLLV
jgi:plasmid stabilization system protein ParE